MYLTPPLKGFPLEFVSAQGSQKTRMMGLSDDRKSFPIGLAVLIQYRSVTATQPPSHPASHVAVAITLNALAKASSLKTYQSDVFSSRNTTMRVFRGKNSLALNAVVRQLIKLIYFVFQIDTEIIFDDKRVKMLKSVNRK